MIKNFLILLLSVTFFVGCSSDSDEPEVSNANSAPAHKTGVFVVTKPVANLHYSTPGFTDAYTNEAGEFYYQEGEDISFDVAGIELGTAEARSVITPFNIVPGAATAENSSATSIIVLLMSLDSNGVGEVLTLDNALNTYEFINDFDATDITDVYSFITQFSSDTGTDHTPVESTTTEGVFDSIQAWLDS